MRQIGLLIATLVLTTLAPLWAQGTQDEKGAPGATVQAQPQPQPARGDVLAPANLATRLNLTEEQRAPHRRAVEAIQRPQRAGAPRHLADRRAAHRAPAPGA
jgi:hypothetical protein